LHHRSNLRQRFFVKTPELHEKYPDWKPPATKQGILLALVEVWIQSLDTFDHDVRDGIAICLDAEGTPEILDPLRHTRQRLRHDAWAVDHIDGWISKILARSKNREG
jgi:hypothetical protein